MSKELLVRLWKWRPLRYLISGGTAAAANFIVLFVLVHFFHIWYLVAAVLAFVVGITTSFFMQKFFAFSDRSRDRLGRQTSLHIGLQIANLVVNTALMYVGVSLLHIPYLLSQLIISLGLAFCNFFFYRRFVFIAQPAV